MLLVSDASTSSAANVRLANQISPNEPLITPGQEHRIQMNQIDNTQQSNGWRNYLPGFLKRKKGTAPHSVPTLTLSDDESKVSSIRILINLSGSRHQNE